MKLPNGSQAELGTKLEDYVLNPFHKEGKHKARVFESALGITLSNKNVLAEALLKAALSSEEATSAGENLFGTIYILRFSVTTEKGSAKVLSAWIIHHNENFPKLVTCYIV